nr:7192_t:CDS:2 [Entrophospora candida]
MRKSLIQISENITKLKRKLKKDTSALSLELYRRIREVAVSELPWNDPLENQIISDDSDIIRLLPDELQNIFMVGDVMNFTDDIGFRLPQNLLHDGMWKETNEELANVAERILDALHDAWKNPAFESNFVEKLNEGAYVTNIILPAVRASLKSLYLWTSSFLSNFERQSSTSAVRRGSDRSGK